MYDAVPDPGTTRTSPTSGKHIGRIDAKTGG
jgi:hypothetical protein